VGRIHGEWAKNDWVGNAEGIVHGLRSNVAKKLTKTEIRKSKNWRREQNGENTMASGFFLQSDEDQTVQCFANNQRLEHITPGVEFH
jgi:hypothetical protein